MCRLWSVLTRLVLLWNKRVRGIQPVLCLPPSCIRTGAEPGFSDCLECHLFVIGAGPSADRRSDPKLHPVLSDVVGELPEHAPPPPLKVESQLLDQSESTGTARLDTSSVFRVALQ